MEPSNVQTQIAFEVSQLQRAKEIGRIDVPHCRGISISIRSALQPRGTKMADDDKTVIAAITTSPANATSWSVLGDMNGQDIEALCFLVLMQAAKSAQEDLKDIMDAVISLNHAKTAEESFDNSFVQRKLAAVAVFKIASALRPDAVLRAPDHSLAAARKLCRWIEFIQRTNCPNAGDTNKREFLKQLDRTVNSSQAAVDAAEHVKNDLDSMSEMGETESLRLQMAMDRLSKMMSTLSNLLKKISDTAQNITQNIK